MFLHNMKKKDAHENQVVLNAPPYQLSVEAVLEQLGSDPQQGLSDVEAVHRRERYGANVLDDTRRQPIYGLILRQFKDMLIAVLFIAAALAWYLGDDTSANSTPSSSPTLG